MKKVLIIVLIGIFAALNAKAQLLYCISGKGLTKPSYIVGTMHLAGASFADSIPGIRDALANTTQVYGEVDMAAMLQPDSIAKMQAALMLPEGKTIADVLTSAQMDTLNVFMKSVIKADFTNPIIMEGMGKMTPGGLLTTLTMLMYISKNPGVFDPTKAIDNYFQEQAKADNKAIGGLETMDFQIKALFTSTPMPRQVEQLMCLAKNKDYNEMMANELLEAYYSQDMMAIEQVMNEKQGNNCDNSPAEDDTLINNRNADWAEKLPAIMASHPTLVVVGAAHLPGNKGVLQLLKNAGYTVEGVK